MPFACSICGEESARICVRCTKDACDNHLCPRCKSCSDCCECEVALDAPARAVAPPAVRAVASQAADPGREPVMDTESQHATDLPAEDPPPAPEGGER